MNSDSIRVKIPDVSAIDLPQRMNPPERLVDANAERIAAVERAMVDTDSVSRAMGGTVQSTYSKPSKIDGLIDSILTRFPLSDPVTLVFVGAKSDAETDRVTADVANRLTCLLYTSDAADE